MQKNILTKLSFSILILLLISCSPFSVQKSNTVAHSPVTYAYDANLFQGQPIFIWEKLQHFSSKQLTQMQMSATNPDEKAWLQLALISKQKSIYTKALINALIAWRNQYPNHAANALFPADNILQQVQMSEPARHIALLLPERGKFASSGQLVREGFLQAYYGNIEHVGTQNVKFYDTTMAIDMPSLYKQALIDGADSVIGPLIKTDVEQLSRQYNFKAPVLALNYTDTTWGALPANFYEYGLLLEDEVNQLAERASTAGHKKALILAPQNNWGRRLATTFILKWQAQGGTIQDTWYYTPNTDVEPGIVNLFKASSEFDANTATTKALHRDDFDVIILFATPTDGRIIVPHLKHYVPGYPIYATSAIYNPKLDKEKNGALNDIIICDLPANVNIKPNDKVQSSRLYAVGQDAYLLSQTLTRLVVIPHFPVYGKTGALTVDSAHQIHRKLPCKTLQNGSL